MRESARTCLVLDSFSEDFKVVLFRIRYSSATSLMAPNYRVPGFQTAQKKAQLSNIKSFQVLLLCSFVLFLLIALSYRGRHEENLLKKFCESRFVSS